MLMRKDQMQAKRMAEADKWQGHRRMNMYTNYGIKLTKKETQMLHPADDISYRGIIAATIPDDHICSKHYIHTQKGTIHPDFHRHTMDATGAPLCGQRDACWLCASQHMDQIYLDSAVETSFSPHGDDQTLGPALQNWLHMHAGTSGRSATSTS